MGGWTRALLFPRWRPVAGLGGLRTAWRSLAPVHWILVVGWLRWGWLWPGLAQGFLDTPGAGCSETLVDGEGLLEVDGGFAGKAVLEVGVADSFQGSCFLQGCADLAGDG